MRISDWSSDVCSSDLFNEALQAVGQPSVSSSATTMTKPRARSEERRVGKECAVRVDLGGRRIIKKKNKKKNKTYRDLIKKQYNNNSNNKEETRANRTKRMINTNIQQT